MESCNDNAAAVLSLYIYYTQPFEGNNNRVIKKRIKNLHFEVKEIIKVDTHYFSITTRLFKES